MDKKDNKQVASSYIIGFYQIIEALSHNSALYQNLLTELEFKYPSKDYVELHKKFADNEKALFIQTLQNTRYCIERSFVIYSSITFNLKMQVKPEIKTLFENFQTSFVLDHVKLREYVQLMNNVLVEEVIQDLVTTGQNYINQVMSEGG